MSDNTNNIIRVQKDKNNPYVMLNKEFLNDDRLSYKAKGILAYLLSKPDNWQIRVTDLVNHSREGRTAVYSGLKELKDNGYLKREPVRVDGKIHHWESIVYEVATTPKTPIVENTEVEEAEDFQQNDAVDFQLSENLNVEVEDIENPPYNNKRIKINKDINQSINDDDGEIDEIFLQARIELYEDQDLKNTLKHAIIDLYNDSQTRGTIKNVKIEHITDAIQRLRAEIEDGKEINNTMAYFKKILINCIIGGGLGNIFKT